MVVFNPVDAVSEIIVLCAVLVALAGMYKYRDRIMIALTGDTRLHGGILDCLWFSIFQCCGTCNGDWTRWFSTCICCPRTMRRQNLIRVIGQWLGFHTYSVELRNIVIGELPFDGRADIYLHVWCGSNPAMVTSLQEEKLAKVIHFPEILTLRLKDSPLEEQVCVTVRQLETLGSKELCRIYINAQSILRWSAASTQKEKMKRFQMQTLDLAIEKETPAWILMEFDSPHEARDLDNFRDTGTIRTATNDGTYNDMTIANYKNQYALLDPTGHAIEEPLEEDLETIHYLRVCAVWVFHVCNCWIGGLLVAYWCFRAYAWGCYRRFTFLTEAVMLNVSGTKAVTFPMSIHDMHALHHECQASVEGTGLKSGIPCRPNQQQVEQMCNAFPELPGSFFNTSGQPWPAALRGLLDPWLPEGVHTPGIPCRRGVCEIRNHVVRHDSWIFAVSVLLLVLLCFMRCICNWIVRQKKASLQQRRQEEARRVREERNRTQRGSYFGFA